MVFYLQGGDLYMKIIVAIDSFKGSLNSLDAGNAVKQGILKVLPDSDIHIYPLADGGEGMSKTLSDALQAEWITTTVSDPLGRIIQAGYGYIEDSNTAVIEMASSAGLALLSPDEYNPLITSTYGVGELIIHALERGARHFIIGIGGSATNDCGIGMLKALGYEFLDANNKEIYIGASALSQIIKIQTNNKHPLLEKCTFDIACDVTNPLCGTHGATYIYGPQKGLPHSKLQEVDGWMKNYASIASKLSGKDVSQAPGTGAAGGMGFAFLNFLNGRLLPGAELIMNALNIEKELASADLVVTGEGRLDSQTVQGKAPITVAKLAKKYEKKVIAFCGSLGTGAELCNEHGIDAFFPILTSVCTLEEALSKENASTNLRVTAEQVIRLLK